MCGRFTSFLTPELLAGYFNVTVSAPLPPRYNIAPTQQVAIIREGAGGRQLASARWGLIPAWAKDPAIGNRLINARSETVQEKPAFRAALKKRRCIIPANGFYEWLVSGREKKPLYIQAQDGAPLALAGLWESWSAPSGEPVESCTILTTAANSLLAEIHERMPVILLKEQYGAWLDSSVTDPAQLQGFFQPYPAGLLHYWPVATLVNSPKNDTPACLAPLPE